MSSPSQARPRARAGVLRRGAPIGRGARSAPGTLALTLGLALSLGLGCSGSSLDPEVAGATTELTTTGGTLPALDSGDGTSTGEDSTGPPPEPDDPRLCPIECSVQLPLDWAYDGTAPRTPSAPGTHGVAAMVREADGMLTLGEQLEGVGALHRLDRHGALQWSVPLPLPCDPCELTHVALHPSGDLLLSASGWLFDRSFVLLAARYDPRAHAVVWSTSRPLQPIPGVWVRSGEIAALREDLAVQLYMTGQIDFEVNQSTQLLAYDEQGLIVDDEYLVQGSATMARPPLLARAAPDESLVVGVFIGYDNFLVGQLDRITPPLWHTGGYVTVPAPLDDLALDAVGRTVELGRSFDGSHVHAVLSERTGVDPQPRWLATLALPSESSTAAALALAPDGDAYVAVRTTQAPTEEATPLVTLALSRWTPTGELRWSTTLLQAVAEATLPVALEVDDDEGLVIATVVNDRLRVERRTQRCECG